MEKKIYTRPIQFASLLMAVTFLAHIFLGGPELYTPLRISEVSTDLKSAFSVIWHFVSMQLLLMTITLWWLAHRKNEALFWFVFMTVFGFGVLFIVYGINDLGSIWPMPQWITFGGVAALMFTGKFRA